MTRVVFLISRFDPEGQLHEFRAVRSALSQSGGKCDFFTVNLDEAAQQRSVILHKNLFGSNRIVKSIDAPAVRANLGPIGQVGNDAYCCYEYFKECPPDILVAQDRGSLLFYCLEARRLGVAFKDAQMILLSSGGTLWDLRIGKSTLGNPNTLGLLAMEARAYHMADMTLVASEPTREWLEENHGSALRARLHVIAKRLRRSGPRDAQLASEPGPHWLVILSNYSLLRNCSFLAACLARDERLNGIFDSIIIYTNGHDPEEVRSYFAKRVRMVQDPLPWNINSGSFAADPPAGITTIFAPFSADHVIDDDLLYALERGATLLLTTENVLAAYFADRAHICVPSPDVVLQAMLALGHCSSSETWRRAFQQEIDHIKALLCGPISPSCLDVTSSKVGVSVAILHYNRAALLAKALESCQRQSRPPDEILIVDDGSYDPEALFLLSELEASTGDIPIRVLRQPNRYLGAARNAAMKAAKGDLVYLLDDDNLLRQDALEYLVLAQTHSNADFIGSFVDNFIGEAPEPAAMRGRSLYLAADVGYALFRNSLLDGNALYRREAYLALGGNGEDYGVGKDDQEFFARALNNGCNLAVLPEAVLLKRASITRLRDTHFSNDAGHLRVIQAYWPLLAPRLRPVLFAIQHEVEDRFALLSPRLSWIDPLTGFNRASAFGELVGLYRGMVLAWFCTDERTGAIGSERVIVTADGLTVYDGPTGNAGEYFSGRLCAHGIAVPLETIVAATSNANLSACRVMIEVRSREGSSLMLRGAILHGATGGKAPYSGNLEGRRDISVRGWVKRDHEQSSPLHVSVFVGGRYYRQLRADLPRAIASLGGDALPHGFFTLIEQELLDQPLSNDTTLEVVIAEAGLPVGRRVLRITDGRVVAETKTGGGS